MKVARVMLLASIPLWWLGPASGRVLAGNAPSAWSNLWRTPDQQGQALLDAGSPAEAAGRFDDPRLRAYADLQAARNQEAAKLLQPFTDADSEYNRGNALAKAGQLQDALAAYDAALKQAPADEDIRHNRDLVARALRQQQKSQSSRNGGPKSGSSGPQQHSGAGQRQGSGSQRSGAGGQRSSGGSQGSSNVAQGGGASPGSSGQQQPGSGSSGTSKEAPGEAREDAAEAAALARQQQQQGKPQTDNNSEATASTRSSALLRPGSRNGDKGQAPGMQTPRQQPETEKQLALDQWLRQIPDSPAGLLQRKFLIEHMMKQQGGDEPPGSGP